MNLSFHNLQMPFLILFAIATTPITAFGQSFREYGKFLSCRSDDVEQANEALLSLNQRVVTHCPPNFVAVQVDKTQFEEASACIHYLRGQFAFGTFECRNVDTAVFNVSFFLNKFQCDAHDVSIDQQRLRDMAQPICGDRTPVKLSPVVLDCDARLTIGYEAIGLLRASAVFRCK